MSGRMCLCSQKIKHKRFVIDCHQETASECHAYHFLFRRAYTLLGWINVLVTSLFVAGRQAVTCVRSLCVHK